MRRKIFLLMLLAWLIVPSEKVCGQWVWNMTHAPIVADSEYVFTALSCSGNNCTAADLKVVNYNDQNNVKIWIRLERSNDGGITWSEQDPGLPYEIFESQTQILGLQQIDSLNVVGYGDSGLVIRTTDAGATWVNRGLQSAATVKDIDFSDSLNGILSLGAPTEIWTTSNGGVTWTAAPFQAEALWSCHTTGAGKYQAFQYDFSKLFSTNDNWVTVDSSYRIDSGLSILGYATFSRSGDTIAARGEYRDSSFNQFGLMYVTTDGGAHWSKASGPELINSAIAAMTDFDHDTLIAGGLSINHLLETTDAGFHWTLDTLPLDTNFLCNATIALAMTGDGHPIGEFTESTPNANSILARGTLGRADVQYEVSLAEQARIYPNPASTSVTITASEAGSTVHLLDILGREVLHGTVRTNGSLTLDVSSLPSGLYYISDGVTRAKLVKE